MTLQWSHRKFLISFLLSKILKRLSAINNSRGHAELNCENFRQIKATQDRKYRLWDMKTHRNEEFESY